MRNVQVPNPFQSGSIAARNGSIEYEPSQVAACIFIFIFIFFIFLFYLFYLFFLEMVLFPLAYGDAMDQHCVVC